MVASFGRQALVRDAGGDLVQARLASRRLEAVCGDRVVLRRAAGGHAVVEAVAPRASTFQRASRHRTKVLAANVTQVVVLVACEPSFSAELVCRVLVAAELAGLPGVIALNKVDLVELRDEARRALDPFRGLGYPVVELEARADAEALRAYLNRQRSLLVGQSGMGKSTLVRALVPGAEVRIGEISRFLDAGRQTTTAARLYPLDGSSEIVDSPGVSEFGLAGLDAAAIGAGFREFPRHAANCRFSDCRHLSEPGCGLEQAAAQGSVHPRRLALYRQILAREGLA